MSVTSESSPSASRLSIIIPTHRERGYIDESVASAFRNVRDGDEVMLVPNGASPEYVARLRRDLPHRCKILELPEGGVSKARNAGAAAASGDLLVFLDDDDVLHDGGLEGLRAVLTSNPEWGAVAGEVTRFDAHGVAVVERHTAPHQPITDVQLLGQCITSPGAVLLRRELFENVGGFKQERTPAEDLDLWLRVALISPVIAIPVPVLRYRVHDGAISSAPVAMARRHIEIFKHHAARHLKWSCPVSVRRAAMQVYRWYRPRLRTARALAFQDRQWQRLREAFLAEYTLLALVITTTLRLKVSLMAQARWRPLPGALEREIAQRGQITSRIPEAP